MIEIRNLRKTFPHKDAQNKNAEKVAVDGLSLTIETGEIFGLLGPNGAGKTTTIRMLTMLTRPTEGEILYDGKRVGEYVIEDLPRVQLVSKMLGKDLDDMSDIKSESDVYMAPERYHRILRRMPLIISLPCRKVLTV